MNMTICINVICLYVWIVCLCGFTIFITSLTIVTNEVFDFVFIAQIIANTFVKKKMFSKINRKQVV